MPQAQHEQVRHGVGRLFPDLLLSRGHRWMQRIPEGHSRPPVAHLQFMQTTDDNHDGEIDLEQSQVDWLTGELKEAPADRPLRVAASLK